MGYWESLIEELRPFMAKQRLKELHTKMLNIPPPSTSKSEAPEVDAKPDVKDVDMLTENDYASVVYAVTSLISKPKHYYTGCEDV